MNQEMQAQTAQAALGFGIVTMLVYLAVAVLMVVCLWKIFTKAGEPGWAAIVPVYNLIVLLKVVGRPIWWIVLWLIPIVNLVVGIIVAVDLARVFGKTAGFAIGLVLLGIVFVPILAFGSSKYVGPSAPLGTPGGVAPAL